MCFGDQRWTSRSDSRRKMPAPPGLETEGRTRLQKAYREGWLLLSEGEREAGRGKREGGGGGRGLSGWGAARSSRVAGGGSAQPRSMPSSHAGSPSPQGAVPGALLEGGQSGFHASHSRVLQLPPRCPLLCARGGHSSAPVSAPGEDPFPRVPLSRPSAGGFVEKIAEEVGLAPSSPRTNPTSPRKLRNMHWTPRLRPVLGLSLLCRGPLPAPLPAPQEQSSSFFLAISE